MQSQSLPSAAILEREDRDKEDTDSKESSVNSITFPASEANTNPVVNKETTGRVPSENFIRGNF
jgi:hypothetical protein